MYTLSEKIEIIQNAGSLREVQDSGIMPDPDAGEGYYFISYSHKDYKQVFCAVLSLQNEGLKLWYDRGLETGKSWLKDVKRRLYSYYCKGVIFFISDNFLRSESIWNEILMTDSFAKSCVFVSLLKNPLREEIGRIPDDRVREALNRLLRCGRVFPPETSPDMLAGAVLSLNKPKLFQYERAVVEVGGESIDSLEIVGMNDISAKKLVIPQEDEFEGERLPVYKIGDNAFANCIELEELIFPRRWSRVKEKVFYACAHLKKVDFGSPLAEDEATLDLSAFAGCNALTEIAVPPGVDEFYSGSTPPPHIRKIVIPSGDFGDLRFAALQELYEVEIAEDASCNALRFTCCKQLRKVRLPNGLPRIDPYAFIECTSLQNIVIPQSVSSIGLAAFALCEGIDRFSLPEGLLYIDALAFYGNVMEKIVLPASLQKISAGAFACCRGLREVQLDCERLCIADDAFAGCKSLKTVVLNCGQMTMNLEYIGRIDYENLSIQDIFLLKKSDRRSKKTVLDKIFPEAETFYIKDGGVKASFRGGFSRVVSDRQGYKKYVKGRV